MVQTTSVRPKWVLPGEQWQAGKTQLEYEQAGGKLAPGVASVLDKPVPTPTPTPTPVVTLPVTRQTATAPAQYAHPAIKTRDLIIGGQKIIVSDPTTQQSFNPTIQPGDTLSALARKYHTTVDQILRDNGLNPAGPTGGVSPVVPGITPEEQARIDAANKANEAAQTIFDNLPGDDIDMRESSKLLEDIYKKLETTAAAIPKPVSMVDLFQEQKIKLGIEPLETELSSIDADIERIQTELLVQAEEAGEKLVSTAEIGRAKGVLQKRAEREIALLNVERSAVARILGNKIDTLNAIIKLTDMDYDNASDYYTKEYNRTIQLFDLVSGIEEKEYTRAERAKDDARATWTVLVNLFKDNNLSYDALTTDQKLKISQLEVQMGLPSGFTAQIRSDEPDKKIQTVTSRTDETGNEYFDVLLVDKDGAMSVKSIFRGKTAPSTTETNKYYTEIDKQKKALREGADWGETWNRIKSQFPNVSDAQIDADLGKISEGIDWSKEGAFEKWEAKEEEMDPVLLKDLKDAIAVISQGADEDEVKKRFLEKHSGQGKIFDDYVGL